MKNGKLIFLVALLWAWPAVAKEYRFSKRVNNSELVKEFQAAGYDVRPEKGHYVNCVGESCLLVYGDGEKKDPKKVIDAHVYRDLVMARAEEEARMRSLLAKLKDRSITAEEKDLLLAWLAERLLGR